MTAPTNRQSPSASSPHPHVVASSHPQQLRSRLKGEVIKVVKTFLGPRNPDAEFSVKIGEKMPGVHDFQKFLVNDAQLKAFGNCVNQVNLFALDPEGHKNPPANPHQRPNRVALVVVSDSDSF